MSTLTKLCLTIAVVFALLPRSPAAQSSRDVTLAIAGATNQAPWVAASGSLVAVAWAASAAGKADIYTAVSRDVRRLAARVCRQFP